MLEAIVSFLPSEGNGAIGALDWTPQERQKLATEVWTVCCSQADSDCALRRVPPWCFVLFRNSFYAVCGCKNSRTSTGAPTVGLSAP